MLKYAPFHVDQLVETGIMMAVQYQMMAGRGPVRKVLPRNVAVLLEFSQNLTQALWKNDDPFWQLPHMDEIKFKAIKKTTKEKFHDFLRKDEEHHKEVLS